MPLKKFTGLIKFLKSFYANSIYITSEEKEFSIYHKEIYNKYPLKSHLCDSPVLIVPLINDLGTMKIITDIAARMSFEDGYSIKYFYVHAAIDTTITKTGKLAYILSQFLNYNHFLVNKLCKVYHINRKDVIFSNYLSPGFEKPNEPKLTSKKELLEINYKNIPIGELIFDTYLRFRSMPDVDLSDSSLYDIIGYFKKLIDYWQIEIGSTQINRLLVPYTAYHHWGIPAYTCLANNIEVVTFGSFNYVFSKPSLSHPYHSKNFHSYPSKFELVQNKEEKINLAKDVLQKRLGGAIDAGTSYMKRSAFSDSSDDEFSPSENTNWCVVFLHCFFDSPHIYGKSLFTDFHEWLVHILNNAVLNSGTTFYIKEHPNALKENEAVIQTFKNRYSQYSNIIFLPGKISNKLIASKKPSAVFTVYGTVAHEFAALKIPVVVAGDNPQSMYGFIHKPKSIAEFDLFLNSIGDFGLPEKYLQEEIYEFFYMHYLYYSSKYDTSNFSKQLDLNKGIINLPVGIPCNDLVF
ncbi:hypothetical protein [Aquirufa antheringensis]|uniref:hypothetical protein n=1 Tax=Aquirufa antheringensis TaxID=2516559 RepID=UPI00208EEB2B|nr:hypothetical protein [Aquirufa antheringensis]USQ03347.1 hypothetical protein G9X63_04245 [Aquirufa antheringensis]